MGRFGTQAHRPRQHRTVSAYWVHHPTEGDYLIDAGFARTFARKGGNYTGLLRLILALIGAGSRSTDGADVAPRFGGAPKIWVTRARERPSRRAISARDWLTR